MDSGTERREILQTGPQMAMIEAQLANHFVVHRLDRDDEATLSARAPHIRAIVTGVGAKRRVDAALLDSFPAVELVANFGVGYDSVDAVEAGRRGVFVTNTPGVLDDEVADLAVALLLATIRRIPQADRFVREGAWESGAMPLTATLRDRTIGIAGMGRIGKAIARRLAGFGRPIVYHSRRPAPDVPYRHYGDLTQMAWEVDALIVIVPGGAATRHLINEEVLAALGPNGVLVNVARGSVVDEEALVRALASGAIAAAGLDVFEAEPHVPEALRGLDNAVLLPHIASATHLTRNAMGQLVVDNLRAWAAGQPLLTPVPETPLPKGA